MNELALANQVEESFGALIALVNACPDQELNTIAFAGSWTSAQVAVHVVLATESLPDTNTCRTARWYDDYAAQLQSEFLNFNTKMKSPEALILH